MKNEKKELLKKFKTVIDDLMDHYEEYTDEEYSAAYGQYFGMMLLNR